MAGLEYAKGEVLQRKVRIGGNVQKTVQLHILLPLGVSD